MQCDNSRCSHCQQSVCGMCMCACACCVSATTFVACTVECSKLPEHLQLHIPARVLDHTRYLRMTVFLASPCRSTSSHVLSHKFVCIRANRQTHLSGCACGCDSEPLMCLQATSTYTQCWSSSRPRLLRATSWAAITPMSSPRLALLPPQGSGDSRGVLPRGKCLSPCHALCA